MYFLILLLCIEILKNHVKSIAQWKKWYLAVKIFLKLF